MIAFEVFESAASAAELYTEHVRVEALSVGVYRLPAGGRDPQNPHAEDEVYYVAAGRGHIRVGDEERAVGPGSVVFVAAREEHRFFDIEDDMVILVFFAPAESETD